MTDEAQPERHADKGLISWMGMIDKAIAGNAGVEILERDREHATLRFRFRGQVFEVRIQPADK
jgi:hypothetical protein